MDVQAPRPISIVITRPSREIERQTQGAVLFPSDAFVVDGQPGASEGAPAPDVDAVGDTFVVKVVGFAAGGASAAG